MNEVRASQYLTKDKITGRYYIFNKCPLKIGYFLTRFTVTFKKKSKRDFTRISYWRSENITKDINIIAHFPMHIYSICIYYTNVVLTISSSTISITSFSPSLKLYYRNKCRICWYITFFSNLSFSTGTELIPSTETLSSI